MSDEDARQSRRGSSPDADDASAESGEATATDGTADDGVEDESLVARVAAHDEGLADEVAALRDRVDDLEADLAEREAEIEDLTERLQRKQADFQNYKKRAKRRQEEIRERATEDLVERLLEVRDNLRRALDQDEDVDVREGVEATLRAFDRVLDEEDVEVIDPDPGATVDPQRHEVMLRVDSDVPADTVAELYRPGYEMGEKVLRPAQVTVSDGTGEGEQETEPGSEGDDEGDPDAGEDDTETADDA